MLLPVPLTACQWRGRASGASGDRACSERPRARSPRRALHVSHGELGAHVMRSSWRACHVRPAVVGRTAPLGPMDSPSWCHEGRRARPLEDGCPLGVLHAHHSCPSLHITGSTCSTVRLQPVSGCGPASCVGAQQCRPMPHTQHSNAGRCPTRHVTCACDWSRMYIYTFEPPLKAGRAWIAGWGLRDHISAASACATAAARFVQCRIPSATGASAFAQLLLRITVTCGRLAARRRRRRPISQSSRSVVPARRPRWESWTCRAGTAAGTCTCMPVDASPPLTAHSVPNPPMPPCCCRSYVTGA